MAQPISIAPSDGLTRTLPAMPQPQKVPTPKDWAMRYNEIEHLYVRERRKLRYIMQYMEREYGFKAT